MVKLADNNPSEANFTAYMNEMRSLDICKHKNYEDINKHADELIMKIRKGEKAQKLIDESKNMSFIRRRELQRNVIDGKKAKEKLLMANIRLVPSIAKRYKNKGLGIDDLVQEGNCGLLHALDKYEIGKGTKFTTYATPWIMQYISRALQNQGRSVRIPAYIEQNLRTIELARIQFEHENNAEPSVSDIAAIVDMPADKVAEYLQYDSNTTAASLDAKIDVNDHGVDMTLANVVLDKDDGKPSVIDMVVESDYSEALLNIIKDKLSATEQFVIIHSYGFTENENQMTLAEIAAKLNMTREGVRQIRLRAENKLHTLLKDNFTDDEIMKMMG